MLGPESRNSGIPGDSRSTRSQGSSPAPPPLSTYRQGPNMPLTDLAWRTRRPAEGYYLSEIDSPDSLPVRTFLPIGYEPNYPYPLLVFLHPHGGNEERVLKLAPRMSRRNYVAISLRGPHQVHRPNRERPGYGWSANGDSDGMIEDYVINAIE